MEYISYVFASSAKALSLLDLMETFPWLSLWPKFQLQSTPPRRHHWGENPMHPTEKFRQCRLISCIVGTKVGCSLILYRGQKPRKTKRKRTSESMNCLCWRGEQVGRGRAGKLGSWVMAGAPWAVRTPLSQAAFAGLYYAKWSKMVLCDLKRH